MVKILLQMDIHDSENAALNYAPLLHYADMLALQIQNTALDAAALRQMQALEKKIKQPVALIFPLFLLQNNTKKRDKSGAVSPEEAVSMPYDRFLLLSGLENGEPYDSTALLPQLDYAREHGFKTVLLSYPPPLAKRTKFIEYVGYFLQNAHKAGLESGVAGNLQLPDIPRLLPYKPDYLAVSLRNLLIQGNEALHEKVKKRAETGKDKQIKTEKKLSAKESALKKMKAIRSFIPRIDDRERHKILKNKKNETDKILVSDFIVPVHIGAYAHEKQARQSVCFNVEAHIARISSAPYQMGDIFSYDIILDAIERLTSVGHIELVENLAEQLAAFLLEFPRVQKVIVRVEKLDLAPRAVGVEITRTR